MLDAAVVGAGVGGLVAAGLLARGGRSVTLLEAHDRPGGCASWYERAGFTFDAGATTLVGVADHGPLARLTSALGADHAFSAGPVDGVAVELPGTRFFYGRDDDAWDDEAGRLFPRARPFFARLRRDSDVLWETARRWPALPVAAVADLPGAARALHPDLLRLAPTAFRTVADVERLEEAPSSVPAFRLLVDLSLLITVQSRAGTAPWWNGALGIDLFRRGVSRPRGGMRSFVTAMASAFVGAGGSLRTRTLVTGVHPRADGWSVTTAGGEELRARAVVLAIPVADAARLLPVGATRARAEAEAARLGDGWGALALNLGLSRVVNSDPLRLHRLVVDDRGRTPLSLFLSFSPPGDPVAPPGGQTLSVSTHVETAPFSGLGREAYAAAKERARALLRGAVERAVPGLGGAVACEDLATPRTFARYTRRSGGSVGGLRLSLRNSGLRSLDPTLGARGLVLAGDTAFPGQGTLAVAISGALAAERLGAVRLGRDGSISFRG